MPKFKNGQFVIVPEVGREGVIIGIAEYRNHEPDYQLRWTGERGEKAENWFGEGALAATQRAAKEAAKPAAKAKR